MSTTTSTTPQARRTAAIALYTERLAVVEGHRARGDKAATLKAAGRLGSPVAAIREAELDLALEGKAVTPWVKPVTAKTSQLQSIGTPTEVQAKVDQLKKLVAASSTPESVKATASKRLEALKAAAKKRGIQVR